MRKTKSPTLAAVHDTANGLHKAGVMDQVTLREFDQLCLPPVEPLAPAQIKRIRESSHVSQAVFARLLNISVSTVQKWETPDGQCKFPRLWPPRTPPGKDGGIMRARC